MSLLASVTEVVPMRCGFSAGDLEFVRRAAKEIVYRLLPDDLPVFDVVWQALGPTINDLASRPACDATEAVSTVKHLRGQRACGWLTQEKS